MFIIEICDKNNDWVRFTEEPFPTRSQAESHVDLMIVEYSAHPDRIRIIELTEDRRRQDLIAKIMKDPDAMQRALSILRTETLVDLLK